MTRGSTYVVGSDGAVGLCGVLAARRLGAERIIAVGRHPGRLEKARGFDMRVDLAGIPEGYRAMHEREALKVLVRP